MGGSLLENVGGPEGCRRLSAAFYARVDRDPVLRPLFSSSFHCAVDSLARFLAQFLGGPCEYSKQRWSLSLREAHARFRSGPADREAWLRNMQLAMEDVGIEEQSALIWFFEQSSAHLIEQPPAVSDAPLGDMAERWEVQRTLEDAVAAVRSGDTARAIALAEGPLLQGYFVRDRSAWLSLLAVMSCPMAGYVRERLARDPHLALERYTSERTLL